MRVYERVGKRVFDVVAAALLFVLLSPVLLIAMVLVNVRMGGPVIFAQPRPGYREQLFNLLKIRTMTDASDQQGNLLPDGARITRLGAFLRRTSIDELPELINVIRGEMSLVGPRPLLVRYLPYFTEEERERFTVRPGITGLAQISGRNDLDWDARIANDVRYARTYSFKGDLAILLTTVKRVVLSEGVRVDPRAVRSDFDVERSQRLDGV
jgi:undecaprenyl phosphate N,N'-diacetylbacillosamine 1-phosphate transferase